MSDVTRILSQIEQGDPSAAEQLLPLVYDELRKLAAPEAGAGEARPDAAGHGPGPRGLSAARRCPDRPSTGTAAATSSPPRPRRCGGSWSSRPGGERRPSGAARRSARNCTNRPSPLGGPSEELLAVDEVLDRLAEIDPAAANLVKLRFFAGLNMSEAAEALGISVRSAHDVWAYARAWLHQKIGRGMSFFPCVGHFLCRVRRRITHWR